jgi:hypothetical protein
MSTPTAAIEDSSIKMQTVLDFLRDDNLTYLVIVGKGSSGKTSALKDALRAISEMQEKEREEYSSSLLVWNPGEGIQILDGIGGRDFTHAKMVIIDWNFDTRLVELLQSRAAKATEVLVANFV